MFCYCHLLRRGKCVYLCLETMDKFLSCSFQPTLAVLYFFFFTFFQLSHYTEYLWRNTIFSQVLQLIQLVSKGICWSIIKATAEASSHACTYIHSHTHFSRYCFLKKWTNILIYELIEYIFSVETAVFWEMYFWEEWNVYWHSVFQDICYTLGLELHLRTNKWNYLWKFGIFKVFMLSVLKLNPVDKILVNSIKIKKITYFQLLFVESFF